MPFPPWRWPSWLRRSRQQRPQSKEPTGVLVEEYTRGRPARPLPPFEAPPPMPSDIPYRAPERLVSDPEPPPALTSRLGTPHEMVPAPLEESELAAALYEKLPPVGKTVVGLATGAAEAPVTGGAIRLASKVIPGVDPARAARALEESGVVPWPTRLAGAMLEAGGSMHALKAGYRGLAARLPEGSMKATMDVMGRVTAPTYAGRLATAAAEGLPYDIAQWIHMPEYGPQAVLLGPSMGSGLVTLGAGMRGVAGAAARGAGAAAGTAARAVDRARFSRAVRQGRIPIPGAPRRGPAEEVVAMLGPEARAGRRSAERAAPRPGVGPLPPSPSQAQESLFRLKSNLQERWNATQANKPGPKRGFGRSGKGEMADAISRLSIWEQERLSAELFDETIPDVLGRFNKTHRNLLGGSEVVVTRNRGRGVYQGEAEPMVRMGIVEPNEGFDIRGLPADPAKAREVVRRLGTWFSTIYGQDAFAAVRAADDGDYQGWYIARQDADGNPTPLRPEDVEALQQHLDAASFDLDHGFGWAVNFGKDWGKSDSDFLRSLVSAVNRVDGNIALHGQKFNSIYDDVAEATVQKGVSFGDYLRNLGPDPGTVAAEAKELADVLSRRVAPVYRRWGKTLPGGREATREIASLAKELRGLGEPTLWQHLGYGTPGRIAARTAGGAAAGGALGAATSEPGERWSGAIRGAIAGAAIPNLPAALRSMSGDEVGAIGGRAKMYSRLARAVESLQRKKPATPAEWKRELQAQVKKGNLSQDELEWAGIEMSYPDPNARISKEDLLAWAKREGYGGFEEERFGRFFTGKHADPTDFPVELKRFEDARVAYEAVNQQVKEVRAAVTESIWRQMAHDPDGVRRILTEWSGKDPVQDIYDRFAALGIRGIETLEDAQRLFESGRSMQENVDFITQLLLDRAHSADLWSQHSHPAREEQVTKELSLAKGLGVEEGLREYRSLVERRQVVDGTRIQAQDRLNDLLSAHRDKPTKWGGHSSLNTPATGNRRGITFAVPEDPDAPGRPFTFTSHYPTKDFFAHVRMGDLTGPGGESILFLDEIQSDWMRTGHEGGFLPRRRGTEWEIQQAQAEVARADRAYQNMAERLGTTSPSDFLWGRAEERVRLAPTPTQPWSKTVRPDLPQRDLLAMYREDAEEARARLEYLEGKVGDAPAAPMRNAQQWTGLAVKRALAEAAAGNYDQVAIINGIQSAARYGKHNFFDWVEYDPRSETLEMSLRHGGSVTEHGVRPQDLDDFLPDQLASYIEQEVTDQWRWQDSYNEDVALAEEARTKIATLEDELEDLRGDYRQLESDMRSRAVQGEMFMTVTETRAELQAELDDLADQITAKQNDLNVAEAELEDLNAAYGGDIENPDYYGPASVDADEVEMTLGNDPDEGPASHYNLYGVEEEDIKGVVPLAVNRALKQIGIKPESVVRWVELDLGYPDWKEGAKGLNLVIEITPEMKKTILEKGQPLGFVTREITGGLAGAGIGGLAGAAAGDEEGRWKRAAAGAAIGGAVGAGLGRLGATQGEPRILRMPTDEELVARMKGETARAKRGPGLKERGLTTEDVIGKTERFGETVPEDIGGLKRDELLRQRRLKGIEETTNEGIRTRLHDLAADPRADNILEAEAEAAFREVGADFKKPVTWAELRKEAQVLGLNPEQILGTETRNLTQAHMVGIRNIAQRNARRIREIELELDGRNPAKPDEITNRALSEADRQALREEAELLDGQNTALLGKFMQQRTEFGRALNAMKLFSQYTKMPDGTLDQLAWQAKARRMAEESGWGDLTPEGVAKIREYAEAGDEQGMLNYVAMLRRADVAKQAMTLWKAGLLTNPATHVANLTGNTTMLILENLKDRPAYILDRMMSAATGVRTKGAPEGIWTSSAQAALDGVEEAKQIMTGKLRPEVTKLDQIMEIDINLEDVPIIGKLLPMKEVEGRRVNVFLDSYQKFIYRALGAGDRIFRKAAYARSLREQANLMAEKTGDSAEYWLAHATDDMHLQAVADAELAIFVNRGALGSLGSTAKRGAWSISPPIGAAAEYAMPFTMTPANIVSRAIEYSGLGMIGGLYDFGRAVMNKGGGKPGRIFGLTRSVPTAAAAQRRAAERMGRAAVGIVPVMLGYMGYNAGILTGEYPAESSERNLWQIRGTQPNAIQSIPGYGKSVSLERVSPFGNLVNFGASLARSMERGESFGAGVAGGALAIPRYAVSQSFLRGTQQILDWISSEDTGLGESTRARFAQNVGSGFVPNILRSTARVVDPTIRQREIEGIPFGNLLGGMAASTPFLSKTMPPRRDVFGYERERLVDNGPIASLRYAVGQYASPFTTNPDLTRRFPENKFLSDVGYAPSALTRMRAEGETQAEFQDRQMEVGDAVLQAVQALMNDPSFRQLSKDDQQERLAEKISDARSQVSRRYRTRYRERGGTEQ